MNDATTAPEVNAEPETTVNEPQETEVAEPTVADLHKEVVPEKKVPESIPKARLDKEIQKRKALEKELADLRAEKGDDPEVDDVDDDSEVKKLAAKLDGIEKKGRQAELNAAFDKHFKQAIENSPEYADVANIEVVRQLAFNPANANKTYKQLLEEAYGNAITGRRTIETTTPRGGAKDSKVDIERTQTDAEYRRAVLADPDLKKQYNEGLLKRIPL